MSEQHNNLYGKLVNSTDEKNILVTAACWNKALQILQNYKQNNFASYYKLNNLKQSITHRFWLTNSATVEDYLHLLENSAKEKELLYNLVIPTKTKFFHDAESWNSLAENVISQLMFSVPQSREIRCWVIGCGTGEEAYSLAMLLDETIFAKTPSRQVKIVATDIDIFALKTALKGVYSNRITRDISPERLRRYFTKQNDSFIVKPLLSKLVTFTPHNLVKSIRFADIDLICCRNTLIYLKPEYRDQAFSRVYNALSPQGFLFLGNNESLQNFRQKFIAIKCLGKIFQKRQFARVIWQQNKETTSIVTSDRSQAINNSFSLEIDKLKDIETELESTPASLQHQEIEEIHQELITANVNIKNINQELYLINQTCQRQVAVLKELNGDLENLLGSIDIGVIFLDRQLNIRKYNSSAKKIFSFRASDLGRPIQDLKHNLDCTNLIQILRQFLQNKHPNELEVRNLSSKEILLMKLHCYRLESRSCEGVIITFVNISDRKQAEKTLRYQAFYDSLTGLPNRFLFKEQLQQAVNRLSRQNSQFLAILYLDLNGFKEVNDSLGHSAGDLLLIEVARRLNAVIRANDIVSRLGGDEFIILLEEIEHPEQSLEIASRIHQIFSQPFSIGHRQVTISTSIGVAFHSARDNLQANIEILIENADMAMYRAKQRGVAQTEIFIPVMRTQAEVTIKLKTQLRQALQQEQFVLYYQPIFDLSDGKLRGLETLLRWRHPKLGLLEAEKFLPSIQNSAWFFQLECWILQQACRQLKKWLREFNFTRHFDLSINISPQLLTNANFLTSFQEILEQTGAAPQSLTFEITETALIDNPEDVARIFKRLRDKGITIALDDFGTGFSSLAHLHRFDLDIIKIDRSFIMSLDDNERSKSILRSIIFMSQQLDLTLVAEGIEALNQLQWLRENNCQLGQGYFWSPSVSAATATELLASSVNSKK